MNSLIIGSSSQLSHYFPKYYERISSRDLDLDNFKNKFYDRIFICFAEQRTFLNTGDLGIFSDVNVHYTTKLVSFFKDKCNKVILYGTSELWNNYQGKVSLNLECKFDQTPYIVSKWVMTKKFKDYKNVIILHPFNFNSPYRKSGFLFGKIFDSIINKKHIEIGDTYFYRDLVHPSYVVQRSILADKEELVGSGRLVFINDFIRDLYKYNNMDYNQYVTENYDHNLNINRKIYYLDSKEQKYYTLLKDTLDDIRKFKKDNTC